MCVSGYREAITISQTRAALLRRNAFEQKQALQQQQTAVLLSDDNGRPIRAKVGRVLGRLRRGRISPDQQALGLGGNGREKEGGHLSEGNGGRSGRERETMWKLSESLLLAHRKEMKRDRGTPRREPDSRPATPYFPLAETLAKILLLLCKSSFSPQPTSHCT